MKNNRRDFIKKMGSTSALMFGGLALTDAYGKTITLKSEAKITANDKVRIALIGSGIIICRNFSLRFQRDCFAVSISESQAAKH